MTWGHVALAGEPPSCLGHAQLPLQCTQVIYEPQAGNATCTDTY